MCVVNSSDAVQVELVTSGNKNCASYCNSELLPSYALCDMYGAGYNIQLRELVPRLLRQLITDVYCSSRSFIARNYSFVCVVVIL